MPRTASQLDYETKQVNRAERDALQKFGAARPAALAYMEDALKMASADTAEWFFEPLGLIRLYARIAFRLAARAWANGEPQ